MTDEQMNSLVKFMKSLFVVVEIENAEEFRTERLGEKFFFKEWSIDELKYLLQIKDNKKLSSDLGRSWMSIDIKRGDFMQPFMEWTDSKGYDLAKDEIKKMIEEYVKEKELEKIMEREKRKEINIRKRKLEKNVQVLEKKLERQQWTKKTFPKTSGIDEAIDSTLRELDEARKKLKEFD